MRRAASQDVRGALSCNLLSAVTVVNVTELKNCSKEQSRYLNSKVRFAVRRHWKSPKTGSLPAGIRLRPPFSIWTGSSIKIFSIVDGPCHKLVTTPEHAPAIVATLEDLQKSRVIAKEKGWEMYANDLDDQITGMEKVLAELNLPADERPRNRGGHPAQ